MYKVYIDGVLFCDSEIDELAIIKPVVRLEENRAGSFEFTIPAEHPYARNVTAAASLVAVHLIIGDTEEVIFLGICTSITTNFFREKKVACEGALSGLNRYHSELSTIFDMSKNTVEKVFKTFIKYITTKANNNIFLTAGTCNVDNSIGLTSFNLGDYLTNFKALEKMVETFGGYLYLRDISLVSKDQAKKTMTYRAYVDYLPDLPPECNQVIVAKSNMINADSTEDETELFTVLRALGTMDYLGVRKNFANPINIPTLQARYGNIEKCIIWDDVNDAAVLDKMGRAYIRDHLYRTRTIEVTFFDNHYRDPQIDSVKPGNIAYVSATNLLIEENMRCISRTYDLNDPQNDTAVFGYNTY